MPINPEGVASIERGEGHFAVYDHLEKVVDLRGFEPRIL
jgi:hypothetical protein